jgi:hypothetical protein
MKKRDIQSRDEAVTKDMQPEANSERTFRFPKMGLTIQAKSLEEAITKVKALKKK